MAKRYITISYDVTEEHPAHTLSDRAIDAHETDLVEAHLALANKHLAEQKCTSATVACNSNDPHAVAEDIPPEHGAAYRDQADRHAAVDAMVHGHPNCKPGGTAHEHAKTILGAMNSAHNTARSLMRILREIDPKELERAHARLHAKIVQEAVLQKEHESSQSELAAAAAELSAKIAAEKEAADKGATPAAMAWLAEKAAERAAKATAEAAAAKRKAEEAAGPS